METEGRIARDSQWQEQLGTLLAASLRRPARAWAIDSQALEPCVRRALIPALPWASCQVLPSQEVPPKIPSTGIAYSSSPSPTPSITKLYLEP